MAVDLLECAMTVLHLAGDDDAMQSPESSRVGCCPQPTPGGTGPDVDALQQFILLKRARKLRTRA